MQKKFNLLHHQINSSLITILFWYFFCFVSISFFSRFQFPLAPTNNIHTHTHTWPFINIFLLFDGFFFLHYWFKKSIQKKKHNNKNLWWMWISIDDDIIVIIIIGFLSEIEIFFFFISKKIYSRNFFSFFFYFFLYYYYFYKNFKSNNYNQTQMILFSSVRFVSMINIV